MCAFKQGSHLDRETWYNGKTFYSQRILNRLEKSGKITQNTGKFKSAKFREFQTNIFLIFSYI